MLLIKQSNKTKTVQQIMDLAVWQRLACFTVGLHACFSSEKHENILMLIFVKKYRDTVSRTTHQAWGRGVLTGLVLCSLDSGLQVSWRVEVLALVSAAAAFNIVHADNDRVLVAVHHARLQGVSVAAVVLTSRAVPALEFSANLAGQVGAPINNHLSAFFHKT